VSTKLQQIIARSRLSTLDGDLREAGEQMLRDKFFPKNNSTEIDRDILEALMSPGECADISIVRWKAVRTKVRIQTSVFNI